MTCLTSASIRIMISPVRWIMPKIGGFSLTSVPRPRASFRRRRRPARSFLDGLGIPLMSSHYIKFVALDLAFEGDGRGVIDDPLAELLDHRLDVAAVHVQLLGDLQTRQV